MQDESSIKVNIAGREYPLKVNASEHKRIIKAAEMVNERITLYEKSYTVTDKQDLFAMCLLNFATQILDNHNEDNLVTEISENLKDTEQYLTTYLNRLV